MLSNLRECGPLNSAPDTLQFQEERCQRSSRTKARRERAGVTRRLFFTTPPGCFCFLPQPSRQGADHARHHSRNDRRSAAEHRARRQRRGHRRIDQRCAGSADRRAGTLRDSEPASRNIHRDGGSQWVQESGALGRGAARRIHRAHGPDSRARRTAGGRVGDGRGAKQHHDRESGDRAWPRRAAVARSAAQQPRHPGHTVPASAVPLGNVDTDPASRARLPFPIYGTFMDITENRGEGQFNALQFELRRRFKGGLAVNAAYTLAGSDGNAPDSGNSTIGVVQYDPYDIEKDRGPDPNVVKHRVVMNGTWDIPVGRGRRTGGSLPLWADAIVGGWTVSTIFQARSGPNLTPYFTYGDTGGIYPANTGRTLDGVGQFGEAWRPDVTGNPNTGGNRDRFFDLTKFKLPAPGSLGNAGKGTVLGPGTWIVNFALYKDIVRSRGFTGEFSALLDNAFNHPQFSVGLGTTGAFMDLTDYLINGVPENGATAALDADTVGSNEGFSVGRVVRLGVRMRF